MSLVSVEKQAYNVLVPANRPLVQMIKGGPWSGRVNPDINATLFPSLGERGQFTLRTVRIGRNIDPSDAILGIRGLGFEPAFIGMVLAFGRQQWTVIELGTSVIGLGSVGVSDGDQYSPCLQRNKGGLSLGLRRHGYPLDSHFRCLVFDGAPA